MKGAKFNKVLGKILSTWVILQQKLTFPAANSQVLHKAFIFELDYPEEFYIHNGVNSSLKCDSSWTTLSFSNWYKMTNLIKLNEFNARIRISAIYHYLVTLIRKTFWKTPGCDWSEVKTSQTIGENAD